MSSTPPKRPPITEKEHRPRMAAPRNDNMEDPKKYEGTAGPPAEDVPPKNYGQMNYPGDFRLAAADHQVRGNHPHKLKFDEVDEAASESEAEKFCREFDEQYPELDGFGAEVMTAIRKSEEPLIVVDSLAGVEKTGDSAKPDPFIEQMRAIGEKALKGIMPEDAPPERRHLHAFWGDRPVSSMRVRAVWTLHVGLSPAMIMSEFTEQWFYLYEDNVFDLNVHPEMPTRFSELDEAAHAKARALTNPSQVNYVKLEFLWL